MKYLVVLLVIALIVLHQDNWFWDDETLVWGFFPITLLYHAGISLAAGFTWYLATKFAWPEHLEEKTLEEVAGSKPSPTTAESTALEESLGDPEV